jgi:hypothetical protein
MYQEILSITAHWLTIVAAVLVIGTIVKEWWVDRGW